MRDDNVCLPVVRREFPVARDWQPETVHGFYNTTSNLLLTVSRYSVSL